MAATPHPILAYWSSLPLYLRILILALSGLVFGAILLGGFASLWGTLLGVLGIGKAPAPKDPGPEIADAIRRREAWEAQQAEVRLQEARQQERIERRRVEQKEAERKEDAAITREAEKVPAGDPQKNAILEACEDALRKMKDLPGLLLFVALGASCAMPRGAGDSMPTSAEVRTCFSGVDGAKVLATLQKCAQLPRRCNERCHLAMESERAACQAGLRSSSATLQICRMERDAALSRKCPACACPSQVWPLVAVSAGALIVGIGVGIGIGWAVGVGR